MDGDSISRLLEQQKQFQSLGLVEGFISMAFG